MRLDWGTIKVTHLSGKDSLSNLYHRNLVTLKMSTITKTLLVRLEHYDHPLWSRPGLNWPSCRPEGAGWLPDGRGYSLGDIIPDIPWVAFGRVEELRET